MALLRTVKKAAQRVGNYYKKGWSEFGKSTTELVKNPKIAVGNYLSSGQSRKNIGAGVPMGAPTKMVLGARQYAKVATKSYIKKLAKRDRGF